MMLIRPLTLAVAMLSLAGTTALAAPPEAGVYAGKTGQGRACGLSGKKLCRASATVEPDGSVQFRWAFSVRCSQGRRAAGSWHKTLRSAVFAPGSPESSADGQVSFTHVWSPRAPRSGSFTSTIQGAFEEGVFRGTLRVEAEYTDPRFRDGVVTCRMPKQRSARLVLGRR
jgi:hypothetical protein